MPLGHFFENVPHFGRLAFDHLLRGTNCVDIAKFLQTADDEWLEQYERHFLRQTALMELEFRTDHDDRTTGIIDTFAEQVLAETAALALEHIAERLERAVARTGDRTTMTAVIEQRVHRFLQHALLVPDDDFRRAKLKQVLQTIIAVNDATIKIVKIRSRESAAFQRNERTQIRRNDRQHRKNHPFRACLR